jgi:hypothetical protein
MRSDGSGERAGSIDGDVWTGSFHNRHALVKSFHLAAPSLGDSKRFLEILIQNSNRVHGTATSTSAWGPCTDAWPDFASGWLD